MYVQYVYTYVMYILLKEPPVARLLKNFHRHRLLQKKLYSGIPNVTVWRVLRKHLRWIVCKSLSVNVSELCVLGGIAILL
jgi:hypothetical protein